MLWLFIILLIHISFEQLQYPDLLLYVIFIQDSDILYKYYESNNNNNNAFLGYYHPF